MKALLRVAVAGAVVLVAAGAFADQVTNDAFSVTLPTGFGAFTKQTQTVDGKEGKIETTNYISKSPTGEAVVVTVSKMPGKILNPTQMIDGTRDALLKSLNATVDNETKLPGDMPAKVIAFHSANAFLQSQLAVNNDLLYQLLYVGRSAEQRSNASVSTMFQSFHVNAPAPRPRAFRPLVVEQHLHRCVGDLHLVHDRGEIAQQRAPVAIAEVLERCGQPLLPDRRRRLLEQRPSLARQRQLRASRIGRALLPAHQSSIDQPADDDGDGALIGACLLGDRFHAERPRRRTDDVQHEELRSSQVEVPGGTMRAPQRVNDPPELIHDSPRHVGHVRSLPR